MSVRMRGVLGCSTAGPQAALLVCWAFSLLYQKGDLSSFASGLYLPRGPLIHWVIYIFLRGLAPGPEYLVFSKGNLSVLRNSRRKLSNLLVIFECYTLCNAEAAQDLKAVIFEKASEPRECQCHGARGGGGGT